MIDKYRNQRFEEIRLDRIRQASAVSEILSIEDEGIGTPRGGIRLIETFALGTDQSSLRIGVVEVARATSRAIDRTEHVGTDAAKSRAGDRRAECTR